MKFRLNNSLNENYDDLYYHIYNFFVINMIKKIFYIYLS